jgi:hypothetical protein
VCEATATPLEALAIVLERLGPGCRVLIAGSLYLAGAVLAAGPPLD